jgi:hypothetical protein
LCEQTAQEHPDRGADSADGAPDAECPGALVALEMRADDRQSRIIGILIVDAAL